MQAVFGRKQSAASERGMVVTSHPIATRAAVDVLREGGSAVDAALCAAVTQTVVEPHMTTITGMLSVLHFDAATGDSTYVNGNVNAPLEPMRDLRPRDVLTGRGVAVPGWWAAFEAAHAKLGRVPRERLMRPAIELARYGFPIHPYLFGEMYVYTKGIARSEQGREIYMPSGTLLGAGDLLYQRRAADVLERLVDEGSDYFYRGTFAEAVAEVARDAGGVITREDFEAYEVQWDEPVRSTYKEYEVVASAPPDTGGAHLIEILNLVELIDTEDLYWFARVCEEVRYDGARWSEGMPPDGVLTKEHAVERLALMRGTDPPKAFVAGATPGSNHVTVVDARGDVATLLHSCLCDAFANGLWADGIYVCYAAGHFLRTMPKPGGRAVVFVAPNIVLRDGRPVLASGSPSGALLQCIAQNIVNVIDRGDDVGTSVHRPRFGNSMGAGIMMELDLGDARIEDAKSRGLPVEIVPPWFHPLGAFEGVRIEGTRLTACADPRRTGAAEGL